MRLLYVSPCAWTCTLYVYVYGVWQGSLSNESIARRSVNVHVHIVLVLVQCSAWTATVFGMDSLRNAPIVRRSVDVDVHTILVLIQCLTWTACAAHVVYGGVCNCTVFDNLNSASS